MRPIPKAVTSGPFLPSLRVGRVGAMLIVEMDWDVDRE